MIPESFSFVRTGGMRVTYNLNVPYDVQLEYNPEREPGSVELNDREKEKLVETLLKKGATYCNDSNLQPGYVVADAKTGQSMHWQFFKDNIQKDSDGKESLRSDLHFFAHRTMNEKGVEEIYGAEFIKPYRKLNPIEADLIIAIMDVTQNGRIPYDAPPSSAATYTL